jgi:hypothetical protein
MAKDVRSMTRPQLRKELFSLRDRLPRCEPMRTGVAARPANGWMSAPTKSEPSFAAAPGGDDV